MAVLYIRGRLPHFEDILFTMFAIKKLSALEILDSRGRPTIQANCQLSSGVVGIASVPSGASTGSAEALELRDGDPKRYGGLGCKQAVQNINQTIAAALQHQRFKHQSELDQELLRLDNTQNKSNLGANALLAVSLAFARACARENAMPLYQYFATLCQPQPKIEQLPRLTVNLFSGGKHAGGQVAIQDILIVPVSACTTHESLAMIYAVYQSAAALTHRKYGARALTADEGGLAPPFKDTTSMLQDAMESIEEAGLRPGVDIALAVDVAATHFYNDGVYMLDDVALNGTAMIEQIAAWIKAYPIVSVEDGLAEDDWEHWPALCAAIKNMSHSNNESSQANSASQANSTIGEPNSALVLGDDLLCTNPARIQRAIDTKSANALLLKVNQIGTLTEAAQALALARSADWHVTVSARSGETEDNWLADLAVGWQGDQIKVGSITQSERLAKYNRLLAIEAETQMHVTTWPSAAYIPESGI